MLPNGECYLAAVNCSIVGTNEMSVTLCGQPAAVDAWLRRDETAVELRPQHPWHHPAYLTTEAIARWGTACGEEGAPGECVQPTDSACVFVSATSASVATKVDAAHWATWL